MNIPPQDRVRAYLQAQGFADHLVGNGLEGIIANWEQTSRQVAEGYMLGLDDYLNDVDTRQLIEELLHRFPEAFHHLILQRLLAADERVKGNVKMSHCLWGEEIARDNGWNSERNWWYYGHPKGSPMV